MVCILALRTELNQHSCQQGHISITIVRCGKVSSCSARSIENRMEDAGLSPHVRGLLPESHELRRGDLVNRDELPKGRTILIRGGVVKTQRILGGWPTTFEFTKTGHLSIDRLEEIEKGNARVYARTLKWLAERLDINWRELVDWEAVERQNYDSHCVGTRPKEIETNKTKYNSEKYRIIEKSMDRILEINAHNYFDMFFKYKKQAIIRLRTTTGNYDTRFS
jgi:transcriptional regulator with XRE-family HTH domain